MKIKITYYRNGDEEVSSWSQAQYAEIEPETPCQNIYDAMQFGYAAAEHIRKMRRVADVQHNTGDHYMTVYKAR